MAKQTENNVGIYMRLSQEDMREGESLSIENQKMLLTKFVRDKGWTLISEYVDDGYSGTDFERPAVQKLLADAQSGKINTIVVKDLSRFGRNYIEVGRYVDYIFPMNNIRFIAVSDNVDTAERNSMALEMMPIINLFNEWHSSSTSKKIKAVYEAGAKQGKYFAAKAPYGYVRSDTPNHTPVIDPETAPVVKRIFDMRASGMSSLRIANELNKEGVLCPSEYFYQQTEKENTLRNRHLWCRTTVEQMLKNPMYLGHMVQLKVTSVSHKNHKKVQKDESEWAVVENTHEPIITQEIWDKCREIDRERSTGRVTNQGVVRPLSALMYCADCGFRMKNSSRAGRKSENGQRKQFYVCSSYSNFAKDTCSAHYIEGDVIEKIVLDDIRSMLHLVAEDEDKARKIFLARKQKNIDVQNTADKDKLLMAKKRITELDKLIQSAYEDKVSGEMPASICAKLLEKYEAEQNALSSQVQEIETRLAAMKQDERDVDEYISRLKKFKGAEVLTREMCLELIDSVTIDEYHKGKTDRDIHIYYKFIDKGYSDKSEK